MTRWIVSYTVEPTNQSGAFTVENESMSRGIAQRYAAAYLTRMTDEASDAFARTDITVSYEPDI